MVYHDISQEQLLLLITQAVQAELQKRSRIEVMLLTADAWEEA